MNKEDFEEGFIELIKGAIDEKEKGRYRNANVLYWKALMKLCDYIHWKDNGNMPENLARRLNHFKTRKNGEKVLRILGEKLEAGTPYNIYDSTYIKKQDTEDCKVMENAIKDLVRLFSISGIIKKTTEEI